MTTREKSRTTKASSSITLASAKQLQEMAQRALASDPGLDVYRAARATQGVKLTRKQAAAEMAAREQAEAEQKRSAEQERAAQLLSEVNDRARKTVAASVAAMVDVEEMLRSLGEDHGFAHMDPIDAADVILSHLRRHVGELERALFQLGAYKGNEPAYRGRPARGWFAESLTRLVE